MRFLGQRVWLNEEEKKDFQGFRLGLVDELEPWGSLETQFVCRIAAQMWRLARVPGIEAELLEKMSYDLVDGSYTSLGEAFHKDIGIYNGSLERLARYEAILDRSLNRLLNEYRKIQADRRRRDKQHAEDWRLAGLPPLDRYADYDGHDSDADYGAPHPGSLDPLYQNEAIHAGEITEEFTENSTIAVRPSPAARPRKRREGQERHGGKKANRGKKANHGGNGVNDATARPPLPHPDRAVPPLGS
ncbi:MAG: hypothetical protein V3S64_14595 [bacterium]